MNAVKRVALSVFLVSVLTTLMFGQSLSHHCKPELVTTMTRWGGNMRIVIDLRGKPVRTVRGTVLGPGEVSLETLVQVFRRESSDPPGQVSNHEKDQPAAACLTGDDGGFAFSLPPGEYELRMSQNSGVDVTSVYVTVKRGFHWSRKIRVMMHVGT